MSAYDPATRVNRVPISNAKLERTFRQYLRAQGRHIGAMRYRNRVKRLRREAQLGT
jgi:hypothetical protein